MDLCFLSYCQTFLLNYLLTELVHNPLKAAGKIRFLWKEGMAVCITGLAL